ncbi:hypothetical protein KKA27_02470 [Patescibacteria group bacterium]|nr:hypothetical protein [Patescibacteria group bacterium]MBU2632901.1 hypothetical protein [Patescibacteria group bacterium]
MNNMINELKNRIMKRVYAIWFARKIAPAVFLYMPFLLFVALRETANEFFVAKIVDNFLLVIHNSGFLGVVNLTRSAIINTSVLSMLIIIASLGAFVLLLRRLSRNFRQIRLAKV